MTEVASVRFHGMTEDLAQRLEGTLRDFAQEHGRIYDAMDMRQSHMSVKDLAEQAVMFGMNIWAHCPEDSDSDLSGNVIPMVRRRRAGRPPMMRIALSTIAAVVGTTIVAAATTESVNIPGFRHVASYVYSKNAPVNEVRVIEDHGQLKRVVFERRPGETYDVVHVISSEPLSPPTVAEHDDPSEPG
jgi:hypothetical protein